MVRETILLIQRKHPETNRGLPSFQTQTGMAKMQFIFSLIWEQSCSKYLAAMPWEAQP
jgi:hypothetical protein